MSWHKHTSHAALNCSLLVPVLSLPSFLSFISHIFRCIPDVPQGDKGRRRREEGFRTDKQHTQHSHNSSGHSHCVCAPRKRSWCSHLNRGRGVGGEASFCVFQANIYPLLVQFSTAHFKATPFWTLRPTLKLWEWVRVMIQAAMVINIQLSCWSWWECVHVPGDAQRRCNTDLFWWKRHMATTKNVPISRNFVRH